MTSGSFGLVDHRVYTIKPRSMTQFLDAFERLAMPVLKETLGNPLGMYVSLVGPLNQFVHLWGYANLADYEVRSQARDEHPDFPAYLHATIGLIVTQDTRLLTCAPIDWR